MNTLLKNYFVDMFKESYNTAQKEVFPNTEKKYQISEILPDEFLDILKSEAFDIVGDYAGLLNKKSKKIVYQGIKDGWSQGEITKLLREQFEAETDTWLNTVIRTKSTEIYNEARKKFYETDDYAKEVVVGYEWSAILDDRTSEVCSHLDGKLLNVEESQWLKPPAHYNCRSVLVPITKFEDYDNKEMNKKYDMDKLAGMGGGLLKPGGAKKYAMEYEELNANMVVDKSGDHIVINSPGENKSIVIKSITVANLDYEKPVQIGFKNSFDTTTIYNTTLDKLGGRYDKTFDNWILPKNSAFILSISADIRTDITIIYYVIEEQPIIQAVEIIQ
jgi:SPP1 gp7 family putative phage head morphogenesis protein